MSLPPPSAAAAPPAFGPWRALVHALHALPLGAAALVVPWQAGSWFSLATGALALLHAAAAVACAARSHAAAFRLVRITALASLGFLFAVTWIVVGCALYLDALYSGVGLAVAAGLLVVWAALSLFALPIGLWGWCSTRVPRERSRGRKTRGTIAVAALAGVVGTGVSVSSAARATELLPVSERGAVERRLEQALAEHFRGAEPEPVFSGARLEAAAPVVCREPLSRAELTALVTTVDARGRGELACVQAGTGERLGERLREKLRAAAGAGKTLARAELELIRAVRPLARTHWLLDALKLRPVVDGVCSGERCFAPWQLVRLGVFTHFQPIPGVPDARFGSSLDAIAALLTGSAAAPLVQFETSSTVADARGVRRLERLRSRLDRLDRAATARATAAAERYITAQQASDGIYAYALDPFSSEPARADVGNLARQAGTALVLCELGSPEAVVSAVRALRALAAHAKAGTGYRALSLNPARAQLGHSALPLAALLSCRLRPEVDPEFRRETTALVADLGRFLLRMQRPDGSFHQDVELPNGVPSGDSETLFGAGQAILSLVLLEEEARSKPSSGLPPAPRLEQALDLAMEHYAERHWPRALRSLFFLEENWHCLAARAALRSHRHHGYERFCLDYVAFKSRFILGADEVPEPALAGGYGLGPAFPLHVTPASGFGEALAAAISVKRARGEATEADEARLRLVLRFVAAQQWDEAACFACATPAALGGFSESAAATLIRVDYVQHALAALGHGAPLLGMR